MRLLVIEDDEAIARSLQRGLKSAAYSVDVALTGQEGVRLALANDYELVVLDYYLPDANGVEIAKQIREKKRDLFIIALSNEPNVDVKIEMLSVCDDYMTKPFSLDELMARIQAVTRRKAKVFDQVLSVNGVEMCTKSYTVKCDGNVVPLSNKEFLLLKCLIDNSDRVLSRNLILEKVWDMNADPFTNTVDVHIQRIREKIGPRGKKLIVTISGVGYKFVGGGVDKV